MSELKTKKNDKSVDDFLQNIDNNQRREDCLKLLEQMVKWTKEEPKMWGDSIVGFGNYHYKYKSGREGDWFLTGFSPRKQNLTIYIMSGFEKYQEIMQDLGKYKTGSSCLYIKKLADVDMDKLETLVIKSIAEMRNRYK